MHNNNNQPEILLSVRYGGVDRYLTVILVVTLKILSKIDLIKRFQVA